MARVGLAGAWFVGHAMGGRVATDLAAAASDRVERLVLVAPAIFSPAALPRPPCLGSRRRRPRYPSAANSASRSRKPTRHRKPSTRAALLGS